MYLYNGYMVKPTAGTEVSVLINLYKQ